jgi:hypothetical protein
VQVDVEQDIERLGRGVEDKQHCLMRRGLQHHASWHCWCTAELGYMTYNTVCSCNLWAVLNSLTCLLFSPQLSPHSHQRTCVVVS